MNTPDTRTTDGDGSADETVSRRSIWESGSDELALVRPPLDRDVTADVCVVGAGIAGLSTAYELALDGKSVVVLDDGRIGGGQTARTTAHLASALDDRFSRLEKLHGVDGSRLAAESHAAAIDRIERHVGAEQIECGFERLDGYLFLGPSDAPAFLDAELEAARRARVEGVERLRHAQFPSPVLGECIVFPRQGALSPLRYLAGLARAVESRGGAIFGSSRVTEVAGGKSAHVRTAAGRVVSAGAVVVATNVPINDRFVILTKQAAYRSYVISATVPPGSVPRALLWDTADPYHYVRLSPGHDRLVVGGEDHRSGHAHDFDDRFRRLEAWARTRFPGLGPIENRWSGQVMETVDGLAFIGRNPNDEDNVFVATGDSGMGMTHGTIAGMIIPDLVAGRANRWASLYDPSRKPIRAALEYAKENVKTVARYADWLGPGEVRSAADIAPGSGAVYRVGIKLVAGYRDESGVLHEMSAKCGHLGCAVTWNASTSTWDWPCHGSIFDRHGEVVNGPANGALEPIAPQPASG